MSLEAELKKTEGVNASAAIGILNGIITNDSKTPADLRIKEQAIYKLGELLAKEGRPQELRDLLTKTCRPFFDCISKAQTSHVVVSLISLVGKIPNTLPLQVELCEECISWSKQTNRTFLRHKIETRMAALYLATEAYDKALKLLRTLLYEIKKFDDKQLLVEIQLIESKVQHRLRNIPKAKAALTSARTAANSIYCPPALQAQIDMQSGTLHAEEKDYKTAYSYFYESFEGYNTLTKDKKKDNKEAELGAVRSLKYILLTKIMLNSASDVHQIISGKSAAKYAGPEMEALKAVANAHKNRSLQDFEKAKKMYKEELSNDPLIHSHLSALEDTLLEQNLSRIIEPFSCVEVDHVAELIELPLAKVEKKLSQMILDSKLNGILDQGAGTLILFDKPPEDETYPTALDAVLNMNKVVDSLYAKAKKLNL